MYKLQVSDDSSDESIEMSPAKGGAADFQSEPEKHDHSDEYKG